jgi:hypothetical protein
MGSKHFTGVKLSALVEVGLKTFAGMGSKTFVATVETPFALPSGSPWEFDMGSSAPVAGRYALHPGSRVCLRGRPRGLLKAIPSVGVRFRFPADETTSVSTGVSCSRGVGIPLILPLFSSSTARGKSGTDATGHLDLTFGAIIEGQRCESPPTKSTYLCRMRRGFCGYWFVTSEPTKRLHAMDLPNESKHVLHAEGPERAVHTDRQLQMFHWFLGSGQSTSGSQRFVNRNLNGPCFRWLARTPVPRTGQTYEAPSALSESPNVRKKLVHLLETKWNLMRWDPVPWHSTVSPSSPFGRIRYCWTRHPSTETRTARSLSVVFVH